MASEDNIASARPNWTIRRVGPAADDIGEQPIAVQLLYGLSSGTTLAGSVTHDNAPVLWREPEPDLANLHRCTNSERKQSNRQCWEIDSSIYFALQYDDYSRGRAQHYQCISARHV